MTEHEKIFWSHVRNRQINNKRFRRQVSIGSYIADFYCPEIKLVVEIDGGAHYNKNSQEYDKYRDEFMHSLGLTVKRYTNHEVESNIQGVIEDLRRYCM